MSVKKARNFKLFKLILSAVLIFVVFSAFCNVFAQIEEKNAENREIAAQIAEQEEIQKQLQNEKLNMHSDENYKRIARQTLGLVEPGDKVYINSNDNK